MRLIDVDALIDAHYEACNNDSRKVFEAWSEELMDNAPLVDAVEVVRCEDCVAHDDVDKNPPHIMCGCMSDNGYCNYGKRSEE